MLDDFRVYIVSRQVEFILSHKKKCMVLKRETVLPIPTKDFP